MIGLTNTATIYERTGQSGGRPAYSAKGTTFRCRVEPAQLHRVSGQSIEETADTLFFANEIRANPGDRIVFGGRNYLVREVQVLRLFRSVHHLEILAKAENA